MCFSSPTFKPSNVQRANGTRVFNHFRTLSFFFPRAAHIFNNLHTLCIVKSHLTQAPSIASALFCKIYGVGIPLRVLDSRQKLDGMGDMPPSGFRPWTPAPCSQYLRGNACAGFRPANLSRQIGATECNT